MNILITKISRLEKNEYIKTISIVALVLSALITIATFSKAVFYFGYEEFFSTQIISQEIEKLSAGQDIDYFKKLLGSQILQREVNPDLQEFIFYYKDTYIQTLVRKKDNSVIFWSITDCNRSLIIKRTAFQNYANRLILNKTSFKNFFANEKGDLEISISGATANSYAYESIYLGNPSSYQTVIVGVNDVCGYFNGALELNGSYPEDFAKDNQKEVSLFRENTKINTYGESAPLEGDEVVKLLKSSLNFGVDRIRVRYFVN